MLEISKRLIDFLRNDLAIKGDISLHEPTFAGNEWKYVKDCIDTAWVSSVGKYVDRFEQDIAEKAGAAHGVAVVNGTSGLHVALYVLGVQPGDLVICPTLTFVATANAISFTGADPLFADSDMETLGLCPDALEKFLREKCTPGRNGPLFEGRRIAACVPVHIFGLAARMERIMAVCDEFSIPVIEDSTEGLGASRAGTPLGNFGKIGVFSFNGNKIITTGGGGALTTNDAGLARRLKHLTTTARQNTGWRFDHDEIAWNYRLPNINAALGCAQLEQLDGFVKDKRRLAGLYADLVAQMNDVSFVSEPAGTRSNYWLNAIMLRDANNRDQLLQELKDNKIQARPCWTLMHHLVMYKDKPRCDDLARAEEINARLVNIPSTPTLVKNLK